MAVVHIVGAGLAGLAAANDLAEQGVGVCLYESSALAGGRCRSFEDPIMGCVLDNGNHLMLGANEHLQAFIEQIGTPELMRTCGHEYHFTDMKYGREWTLKPPFFLPFVPLFEYLQLLKLMIAGRKKTVAQCFSPHSELYQKFIVPLCVAALNTQPEDASAQSLATILRQTISKGKTAMQAYLPQRNWQESLINPALERLKSFDVSIYYQQGLKEIMYDDARVKNLYFTRNQMELAEGDAVILAIPAYVASKLLPITAPDQFNAIINGHFAYAHDLPVGSFYATIRARAHWVFIKDNIISTTTSAAEAYLEEESDAIAMRLWSDLCELLHIKAEMPPHRMITEKRATFACTPSQLERRPRVQTRWQNLYLAGDYVQTGLPATMEGAIISGKNAAKAVLNGLKIS